VPFPTKTNIREIFISAKFYFYIFPILLVALYIPYYASQPQVDFAVFWTAGQNWNEGRNPYELQNQSNPGHAYLNAPSALFLFSTFARLDLDVAAILFRTISALLGLLLCFIIQRKMAIPVLFTIPVLIFSVPFRVTIGSGQVGLVVSLAFFLLFLLEHKSMKLDFLLKIFLGVVVLSLKPYMFLGYFFFLLFRKSFYQILLTPSVFLFVNFLMSPDFFFIREWLVNIQTAGSFTLSEANNSSILALTNRLTGSFALALFSYLALNIFLIYKLWRIISQTKTAIFYTAILAIELSPYVHHQDYLLPLFGFFVISNQFSGRISKVLSIWLGVGLQFNSFLIQALIESYRTIISWGEKLARYSLFFLTIGGFTAYQWSLGNLERAFALYDTTYQAWVLALIVIQIYATKRAARSDLPPQ
jgi:hypothetical protein